MSCGNKLERKNQYRGPLSISISKALGRVGEMVQRVRRLLHKLENPSSISRIHIRSWTWWCSSVIPALPQRHGKQDRSLSQKLLGQLLSGTLHWTVAETRRILPQQGGRRQLTPERCLLTSTYTHTWHVYTGIHAQTHNYLTCKIPLCMDEKNMIKKKHFSWN